MTQYQNPGYYAVPTPKRAGLAITAFVLSIVSFVLLCLGPLLSIPAIIMGLIAHASAHNKPAEYGGGGMALSAMIIGAANVLIVGIMILWLFLAPDSIPIISEARSLANRATDAAHLRMITLATNEYANDNGGAYPPTLADATRYLSDPKMLVSRASGTTPLSTLPASPSDLDDHCDFLYTGGGLNRATITDPTHVIVAYEKDVYHGKGANVAFADGHVDWLNTGPLATALADDAAARAAMRPTLTPPTLRTSRRPPPSGMPSRLSSLSSEKTAQLGGNGGGPFTKTARDGKPLVGVAYSLGAWGGQTVIGNIDPIYDRSAKTDGTALVARDGYVLGGMNVKSDDTNICALQLIFVRMNAGKIDPSDSYTSVWFGNENLNAPVVQLAGHGETVIGIYGRKGMNLDAMGLLTSSNK